MWIPRPSPLPTVSSTRRIRSHHRLSRCHSVCRDEERAPSPSCSPCRARTLLDPTPGCAPAPRLSVARRSQRRHRSARRPGHTPSPPSSACARGQESRAPKRATVDEQRDLGAAVIDAIRYVLVDEPDHALLLGKVAARLFLPRRHRLEPLSALHQRGTITLANRYRLARTAQEAVLAASWLAALHTDPSTARRVPLLLRHEDIARDLRPDGTGAAVREKLDRIVENQLKLALLAVGASK